MSEFPCMMYGLADNSGTDVEIWGVMRQTRVVNDEAEQLEAKAEGFVGHPNDLDAPGAPFVVVVDRGFDDEPADVIGDEPNEQGQPPVIPKRGPGRPPKAKD